MKLTNFSLNFSEVRDYIFNFVKQVRQDFPEKFNNVVNVDPEVASFVQSLN